MRDKILAIKEVSTLPSALARILSLAQDEDASAIELAEEISSDQALALKILRTVNSSYYGFARRVQSVSEAVVILGFDEVERLALAISVINIFGRSNESVRALQQLWRHSLACSIVAGELEHVYRSRVPGIDGARLAGLLHDIGKAVIAQYFPKDMAAVLVRVEQEGETVREAERAVLSGVTHCEIGAWLAEHWGLPPALVEGIGRHHEPEAAETAPEVACAVHIANALCNKIGIGSLHEGPHDFAPWPEALALFPLDAALQGRIEERLAKQRGLLTAVAAGASA